MAVLLLAMSVASWVVILWKAWLLRRAGGDVARSTAAFWQSPSIAEAQQKVGRLRPRGAGAAADRRHRRLQAAGTLAAAGDRSQQLTRVLRDALHAVLHKLQFGQVLLATVGSTAPFVGLLGTVWGIYHALTGIAAAGQITIDKVSGPVGEALIMTAAGLAVAIPAVLAYNIFGRRSAASRPTWKALPAICASCCCATCRRSRAAQSRAAVPSWGHDFRPPRTHPGPAAHERHQRHAAGRRDAGAGGDLHHHRAAAGQLDPAGPAAQPMPPGRSEAPQFVTLVVDKAGQAFLNDQPVTADAAGAAPGAKRARRNPDTEVQLRADQAVPYGRVVEVMGVAQKAGLNRIGFVADARLQRARSPSAR